MKITIISAGVSSFGIDLGRFDEMKVLSGGLAGDITVRDEGNLYVAAAGMVSGAVIYSGGGDFITGYASATVVSGGDEYIQAGEAKASVVESGGIEFVRGGVADASVLNFGAAQRLQGGAAYAATIGSGAVQFVSAGGVADATLVLSGGVQEVLSGGTASGTTVESGGTLVVLSGAVISNVTIQPGGVVVSTGVVVNSSPAVVLTYVSAADNLAIGSGAAAYVLSGGVASATVVSSGGTQVVAAGGIASGSEVLAGGLELVSAGAAYGTLVSGADAAAHSFQDVTGGGLASGTLVDEGGGQDVTGGTVDAAVLNDGAQFIAAGMVSGTLINGGGYQYVGGGAAYATMVAAGGGENVSGGTAYDTVVASGGHVAAGFGGTLISANLAGGEAVLAPGGVASQTVIGSAGVLVLAGGTASGTDIDYGGSEIVSGNARYQAAVSEDFGTTIEAGGSELVAGKGIVSDLTIAGGALGFFAGGAASGSIFFSGGGQMFIDQPQMPEAVISGFAPGDAITLAQITSGAGDSFSLSGGVVMISAGGTVYDLDFAGTAPGGLVLSAGVAGDLSLQENPPCFAAGTRIMTPHGDIAVERLRAGDTVITESGADAEIIWLGRRRLDLARHLAPAQVRPVRITADAFAEGVPVRDLDVSPDHALLIDGVLIPAKALINGRNVRQIEVPMVTYYHVELGQHAVIFAENCAVESYLETGNRGAFENGGRAIRLHPDFGQRFREAGSCAPLVESGNVVEAAAWRLLRRYYAGLETANRRF
jgi:autotransporter passenger strand-loop-strand repeat protein